MTAAHPLRWLLALVALVVPAAVTGRDCRPRVETAAQQDLKAEVVFRHYV